MNLPVLYGHPFSSYPWKVLIPFLGTGTAFDLRMVEGRESSAALAKVLPLITPDRD